MTGKRKHLCLIKCRSLLKTNAEKYYSIVYNFGLQISVPMPPVCVRNYWTLSLTLYQHFLVLAKQQDVSSLKTLGMSCRMLVMTPQTLCNFSKQYRSSEKTSSTRTSILCHVQRQLAGKFCTFIPEIPHSFHFAWGCKSCRRKLQFEAGQAISPYSVPADRLQLQKINK